MLVSNIYMNNCQFTEMYCSLISNYFIFPFPVNHFLSQSCPKAENEENKYESGYITFVNLFF